MTKFFNPFYPTILQIIFTHCSRPLISCIVSDCGIDMDLKEFLLNNASLQSWPRRRHSIADVRFLHTLYDIPENPEEEDTEKERRRSTGSLKHDKGKMKLSSEPPCESTQSYYQGNVNVESTSEANGTTALPSGDCNLYESPRYTQCFSFENFTEDNEHLIEAVSTYVLSYTDDAGNQVAGNDSGDVSLTTTGSSSPQESSTETSDGELALSEMLRKVDTSMAPPGSRRESVIDPDVLERLTSLTPVVDSSRSSSTASVSINLNGSPDYSGGSEPRSRRSSTKNTDSEEGMLRKILVSPRLTRRGSLNDVLRSMLPQFDKKSALGRQETSGNDGKLNSTLLSTCANGHVKYPCRPLFPMNLKGKIGRDESPNIQRQAKNESQVKKESDNALGNIMNFPNLPKRRGSQGDLDILSPQIGSSTSKVAFTEKSLKPAAEKEHEYNSLSKDKDGILRKIFTSQALTTRGSIGNVLDTLSPNPGRRCPSPSLLTIKYDTQSVKRSPIGPEVLKSKDVQGSPGEVRPKSLLAIAQQHVISHSHAMQWQRRNSIASTKPHTRTLELSLKESLDTGEWGNDGNPENDRKSSVLKTAAPIKDSLSNENKNNKGNDNSTNSSVNGNDINTESKDGAKRCDTSNDMRNSNGSGAILNHQVEGTAKASSPSDLSKSKEKSHIRTDGDVIFSVPRQLVGNENLDVPWVQSPQRKISEPLPPRSVAPPQRKSSVNVIKRSPITFVIPSDKSGRTEDRINEPNYQPSCGVGFNNSRFLPLTQEEADDYSRIKKIEASKSATTNSTITMSSRVTVHGGGGKRIVRKLGICPKQPPLNDSLPTEERFAALSERYASLKAKLEKSDSKQKTQDSSKFSEMSEQSRNTDDKLTKLKCWTTVESIPIQQFANNQVSDKDKRVSSTESALTAKDGGRQETDSEENGISLKPRTVTSSEYKHVSGREADVIKTMNRTNSNEKSPNGDANNNITTINKIQVENDGVGNISSMANANKTTLDLTPHSPAQRSRTSVLAKLMNRKMGPRRKQSIVPRVAKRRSKVYTESVSGSNGIPASAAQFEKIRTVVESSVLRAPVRQMVR